MIGLRILLVLLIYLVCRILFYCFNLSLFAEVSVADLAYYSLHGMKYDISVLMYLNALFLVGALLPFKFRIRRGYQKFLKHVYLWPNLIGIIASTIDFGYFPYTLQRSTGAIFSFLERESDSGRLVLQLCVEFWYVPLSALLLCLLFVWGNRKIEATRDLFLSESAASYGLKHFGVMLIGVALMIFGIRGTFNIRVRPIGVLQAGKYANSPLESAIILNTPYTITHTLFVKKPSPKKYFNEEQLKKIYNPIKSSNRQGVFKDKNVVVLIMESFGKEYSGFLNPDLENGQYHGYMPFLDSLMQESRVLVNTFANGRKSIDALPAIVAGIPSFDITYSTSSYSNNRIHSLANRLKTKGYQTSFFHGAENGSMNFLSFTKLAGYDKYYGKNEYLAENQFNGNVWGIHDEPFLEFFEEELNGMQEPFHAALFTLSSHTPFEVPEEHNGKFPEGKHPIHATIGYSDYALKEFFHSASKQPWYDNTLFVITADHCSIPQHAPYRVGLGLYRIPLILFDPTKTLIEPKLDSTVSQQLDIMPTVLETLGYDEDYFAFGHNSLDSNSRHFAVNFINGKFRTTIDNYVLTTDHNMNVISLFNYVEDPLYTKNLKDKQKQRVQKYLRFQKAFLQQYYNRILTNSLVPNDKP